MTNTLYYGDNLDVLSRYVGTETVDLVYLDPPFNSSANYNVLFEEHGERAASQIKAFEDTWHWDENAVRAYQQTVEAGGRLSEAMQALRALLGDSDMLAYLSMMAPRLLELRRVLKPTGSLYLHCDPTASHYLKLLLDRVFGPEQFRGEIIWLRHNARSTTGRWPRLHDTILAYSKTDHFLFKPMVVPGSIAKVPHTLITGEDGLKYQTYELSAPGRTMAGESGRPWRGFDPSRMGRHWANGHAMMEEWDAQGLIHWPKNGGFPRRRAAEPFKPEARTVTVGDVWTDIDRLNQTAKERLGYPTQKPLALLERILKASSNEGDVVLDPFCGCGTAIDAAQRLKRQWIGIDITHLAVNLIKHRLANTYGDDIEATYDIVGEPTSLQDAQALAAQDKFQFQAWALGLVGARVAESAKKGADKGIDGRLYFHEDADGAKTKQVIFSVKGGHIPANHVRELRGILDREKAAIGVLIALEPPTKPMRAEAASAGHYTSPWGPHPRLQILTVEELLNGRRIDMPPRSGIFTFKKAARYSPEQQLDLADRVAES